MKLLCYSVGILLPFLCRSGQMHPEESTYFLLKLSCIFIGGDALVYIAKLATTT